MYEASTEWRTRRKAANLSLREVSRRSGLNRGTISRIERGWPASASQAAALLAALTQSEPKPEGTAA